MKRILKTLSIKLFFASFYSIEFCIGITIICLCYITCSFIIVANYLAVPVPGVNIEEHLQLRQEEKRQRVIRRHRLEDGRGKM